MRQRIGVGFIFGVGAALALLPAAASAAPANRQMTAEVLRQAVAGTGNSSQTVVFPDTGWSPVKVVRGISRAIDKGAPRPAPERAEAAEIISFGQGAPVRVMRGEPARGGAAAPTNVATTQLVTFADARGHPVSILRGAVSLGADTELFGPASIADLERVAFAVYGAESSYGADLRMWRPEPSGPQGPMQVTAAAAIDAGGGDRFDFAQNRAVGRAYLARMYRRYGNWPDAIAAYNWGPGNLDSWISRGRPADKLPLEVERYRERVYREAAVGNVPFR